MDQGVNCIDTASALEVGAVSFTGVTVVGRGDFERAGSSSKTFLWELVGKEVGPIGIVFLGAENIGFGKADKVAD